MTAGTLATAGAVPLRTAGRRLVGIDALRGLAAGLVVAQHVGELTSGTVRSLTRQGVQLGQLGVLLFFLTSGYLVPASLERAGSLRRFWLARVLRLYPAYWACLVAVAVLHAAGRYRLPSGFGGGRDWLVEATMFQHYAGVPDVVGVFWTLAFELAFYVTISVLAVLGVQRRSVPLALLAVAAGLTLSALGRATGHHAPLGLADVASMFAGTVLWRVRQGAVPAVRGWVTYATVGVGVQLLLLIQLAGHGTDTSTPDALELRPVAVSWLVAYLLFALVVSRPPPARVLRPLALTGLVSYSLYLVHPLLIAAVHGRVHGSPGRLAAEWVVGSSVAAAVGYRLVERPAVRLGRRLLGRGARAG